MNGYNVDEWRNTGHRLDNAMDHLLLDAENAVFVAHNVAFDWGFVETALSDVGKKWPGDYHRLCTASLTWPLLAAGKVEKVRLEVLTAYFGIPHEAHRAAGDAEAARQVFLQLMALYKKSFAA